MLVKTELALLNLLLKRRPFHFSSQSHRVMMSSVDNGHQEELDQEDPFYDNASKYWSSIPATDHGMLGGFANISPIDIHSSKSFLLPLLKLNGGRAGCHRVLDCGAGIGRISKHLFLPVFENIDLVELNQNFLNQAKTEFPTLPDGHKLDRCYCSGLQDFTPGKEEYDVIWCQWVLGHLTDDHLVEFFKRCKTGLSYNGLMIVKENVSRNLEFDDLDSSYTRPLSVLKNLIHRSGFRIVKEEKQKKFPKDLFEVRMLALQ